MVDTSKLPISRVDELIDKLNEIDTNLSNLNNNIIRIDNKLISIDNKLDSIDYVIENGSVNSVGYYRIWKSGFIEQWYHKSWNGAWASLAFPKPFTNTDYHISGSGYRTDSSPNQGFVSFKNYTTAGCNVWFSDDNSSNSGYIKWYACGY